MRRSLPAFLAILAVACAGLPGHGPAHPPASQPVRLTALFDSGAAAAYLRWSRSRAPRFQRYEVQRDAGQGFVSRAVLTGVADTVYEDRGLRGNRLYRYRIAAVEAGETDERVVLSEEASGGIHHFSGSWTTGSGGSPFLPTRLVVDRRGTVYVVGSSTGRVARYRFDGERQGDLVYTGDSLACLAAGPLDGPAVAVDSADDLYVVWNARRGEERPRAWWSKFTPAGELVWRRELEGLFARHITIDGRDRIFVESISQVQQFDVDGHRRQVYSVPAVLVADLGMWRGRFAALVWPLSLTESDWQASRLVVYADVERSVAGVVMGRDPASDQDRGGGLLVHPTDFAVSADSMRVFVANAGLGRIEVFADGRFLTCWGRSGKGPGEFRFRGPATVVEDLATGRTLQRRVLAGGIACDRRGRILVADTFNDRIQVFQP